MTELIAQRKKIPLSYVNSARMFVTKPPWNVGSNGGVENSSLLVLVDAITIHTTGSTQYSAPTSRMTVGIRLIRERRAGFGRDDETGRMAVVVAAVIAHSFARYGAA